MHFGPIIYGLLFGLCGALSCREVAAKYFNNARTVVRYRKG
jgi:hypothetical protein